MSMYMGSANDWRHFFCNVVTQLDWAHIQDDPWVLSFIVTGVPLIVLINRPWFVFCVQHTILYVANQTLNSIFQGNLSEFSFLDLNSLWPSNAIRRQGTDSTLAQVMACWLIAPSHYLNVCWLIISEVPWHSSQGIIMRRSEDTSQKNKILKSFRITFRSPRGQCVWSYGNTSQIWSAQCC